MSATVAHRGPDGPAERRRRLIVITLLGFSSGLPLALTDSTLQAWLAIANVDIATVGWFSLLALPYALKFLWAPVLDRFAFARLGRRRAWMLASQVACAALIVAIGMQDPASSLGVLAVLTMMLALASATQDIAVDAYRAEVLPAAERGLGAGVSVAGYKVATVISGAGALVLAGLVGFAATYTWLAVMLVIGVLSSLAAREPPAPAPLAAGLFATAKRALIALQLHPAATGLLALIVLYKLGDAAAGRLTVTFLLRGVGLDVGEVGILYKGVGIGASLVGGVIGGALMWRWGLYRSLVRFAVLQAVTNLGFLALAVTPQSYGLTAAVVALENLSSGMGTAALVALLMALCDRRYAATQFALLSGLASVARLLVGPPAGLAVDAFGWAAFYAGTVVLTVPVLWLLPRLRAAIDRVDRESEVDDATRAV